MEKPLRRMAWFSQILGSWLLSRREREAAFIFIINRSVRFHLNVKYYLLFSQGSCKNYINTDIYLRTGISFEELPR